MSVFRFLVVLAIYIAQLTGKSIEWTWRNFCGLFGGGVGGSATPGPLDLPSKEVYDVDRSLAESQRRAADIMPNDSPARQIRMYALTNADGRFGIDLSKLEPAQQDWLIGLSGDEKAMRTLSQAPETKISMLLGGHDGAVPGLDAPKTEKPRELIPGLVSRMEDFRVKSAGDRQHVLAA